MTIEVQIANKDKKRAVEVVAVEFDKSAGRSSDSYLGAIMPGEVSTYTIHLLRDLKIREMNPD